VNIYETKETKDSLKKEKNVLTNKTIIWKMSVNEIYRYSKQDKRNCVCFITIVLVSFNKGQYIGELKDCIDPRTSANKFYAALKGVAGSGADPENR
jgi:hypothetical protein